MGLILILCILVNIIQYDSAIIFLLKSLLVIKVEQILLILLLVTRNDQK